MEKKSAEAERILRERFGRDSVVALATTEGGLPDVRCVNAYYENDAFYVVTYALSNKMRQIAAEPQVALAGDWFTAHGEAEDIGFFGSAENRELADGLRSAFEAWIDNGDNDLADPNTRILRIRLTDGLLFSHGVRYDIDFRA